MDVSAWWSSLVEIERRVVWINCLLLEGRHFEGAAYGKEKFYCTTLQLHEKLLRAVPLSLVKAPAVHLLETLRELHCAFNYDAPETPMTSRLTLPMSGLREVYWKYTKGEELDFSHLTALRSLSCSSLYKLNRLEIEGCKMLEFCSLTHCGLISFDSRPFAHLTSLTLRGNPLRYWHYSEANAAKISQLDLSATELQSLELRNFPKLRYLRLSYMRCLTELVTGELKLLDADGRSVLKSIREKIALYQQLQTWWEGLAAGLRQILLMNARLSLGVHVLSASYHSIQKEYYDRVGGVVKNTQDLMSELGSFMPLLYCTHLNLHSDNPTHAPLIASLDFLQPLMSHLKTLDLSHCAVQEIVFKNLPNLEAFAARNCPNLREIYIHACPKLKSISLNGYSTNASTLPRAKVIRLEQCPALEELDASNQAMRYFYLFDCPKLHTLLLRGNNIEALTAAHLPASLRRLDIASNKILQLPLINCPQLEKLDCSFNPITSIELSHATRQSLQTLVCDYTEQTYLGLSNCTALESLSVNNNSQLHTIQFQNCNNLHTLSTNQCPKLTEIDNLHHTKIDHIQSSKLNIQLNRNRLEIENAEKGSKHSGWLRSLDNIERLAISYNLALLTGEYAPPQSATEKIQVSADKLRQLENYDSDSPPTLPLISSREAYFYPLQRNNTTLLLQTLDRVLPFFPNLQQLYIAQQSQLRFLSGIENCPELQELHASLCALQSLSGIEFCPKITRLSIDACRVADLRPLAALPLLEYLDISATPVRSLRPLHALKNLRQLICNDCDGISDEEIAAFQQARPQCLIANFW